MLTACEVSHECMFWMCCVQEMLERALGGLRHKLQSTGSNTAQAEKYRRQQRLLERELSRVRSILAHNSKVRYVTPSR